MSKIIGIDLGTTNSAVAMVRDHQPQILPHREERLLPSVVAYSNGKWLVGTPARNQYVLNPENTVRSIKREMGSDQRLMLGPRELTPQEISAFILRALKAIAERHAGQEMTDAVITVPAYFSDGQRQATRDAGRIAGLNVRRIINEPTAAALAYGLNLEEDRLVLVYDLGGGTFDVSLVELMGGVVEVLASHGDTRLGGDDFDERLAEHVNEWFLEEHGVSLREDRRAWARLLRAAEGAKIELSSHPFAWIREEYIVEKEGVPLHLEYEVERAQFEELIVDLLGETLNSIDRVLADGEVAIEDVDQILFVGGSSRIPAVWKLVATHTGLEPRATINPDEAVALGAAVQGAIIAGEPIDAILVDVTPHSLGIAVAEWLQGRLVPDRYSVLIRRNTTIPVTREEIFSAVYPDQESVLIKVYQGEKPVASHNDFLGEFVVRNLVPPRPGDLPQVTVSFDFDLDGILHVRAQDRYSSQQEEITVSASRSRLQETEIVEAQTMLAETETTTTSLVTTALVKRAEALLARDELEANVRARIEDLLADMTLAQTQNNAHRIEELSETLLDLLFDHE